MSNNSRQKRRIFTMEILNEALEKSEATLIGEYKHISGQIIIKFTCKCGTADEKKCQYIEKYGASCKQCRIPNAKEKRNQTSLQRYGVNSVLEAKEIKDRIKQTNMKKYGVESNLAAECVKQQIKQTWLEKYGVSNPNQNPLIIEKTKATNMERYGVSNPNKLEEIKQKTKQTNLEKYGVECVLQTQTVRQNAINTTLERYGVDYPFLLKEIQDKCLKTHLERYRVKYNFENPDFQEKSKETMMERYGVEHALQSEEIREKQQKSAYSLKEYKMPSGEIRYIQGFENYALEELIKVYSETQIMTGKGAVPRISYKIENKTHYYFPDIFIPHENKIIEVKSEWTYGIDTDIIKLKGDACISQGYNFELWIYDKHGKKIESY